MMGCLLSFHSIPRVIKLLLLRFPFFLLIFSCNASASDSNSCSQPIRGINIAGLEFGSRKFAGRVGTDFFSPEKHYYAYYAGVGFNAVRLPITWERLQPKLFKPLNKTYLKLIDNAFSNAAFYGMDIVIDLHNYHRYKGDVIGSEEVPIDALTDVWMRISAAFSTKENLLAYGLMNEPHDTKGRWAKDAQVLVNAIRSRGDKTLLYISGDHWSNSNYWPKVHPEKFIVDPLDNFRYEAHLYLDQDFSGIYADESSIDSMKLGVRLEKRLLPFTRWLLDNDAKGVIGEFGIPNDDKWSLPLNRFLILSQENCLDWFMWAGGTWNPAYQLSLEVLNGHEKKAIPIIRDFLNRETVSN